MISSSLACALLTDPTGPTHSRTLHPEKLRFWVRSGAGVQDAREVWRPTRPLVSPLSMRGGSVTCRECCRKFSVRASYHDGPTWARACPDFTCAVSSARRAALAGQGGVPVGRNAWLGLVVRKADSGHRKMHAAPGIATIFVDDQFRHGLSWSAMRRLIHRCERQRLMCARE